MFIDGIFFNNIWFGELKWCCECDKVLLYASQKWKKKFGDQLKYPSLKTEGKEQ